jgi:RNA polymerase sigma factor (sigma-70 family)
VQDTRSVFLAHHGRLLRLCTLLTGSIDAGEDLAQEAFARALMRASGLPEGEQYPYLRATASNIWKNGLRRLAVERRWRPSKSVSVEGSLEDRDELWRAVVALPVRQRACVVLRFYEDLSEHQTAEILRCSVGTVKSQTSRPRSYVRRFHMKIEDELRTTLNRRASSVTTDDHAAWVAFERRAQRMDRSRRVATALVAVVVAISAFVLVIRAFRPAATAPGGPGQSPSVSVAPDSSSALPSGSASPSESPRTHWIGRSSSASRSFHSKWLVHHPTS